MEGRCLAKDTLVMLYNDKTAAPTKTCAAKKVQDLTDGDVLVGDDGRPRRISTILAGVGPLYRVRSKSIHDAAALSSSYTVSRGHVLALWNVYYGQIEEIPVHALLAAPSSFLEGRYGLRYNVRTKDFDAYPLATPLYDRTGEYWGFDVDGNGRFLLADGTVTHNSR